MLNEITKLYDDRAGSHSALTEHFYFQGLSQSLVTIMAVGFSHDILCVSALRALLAYRIVEFNLLAMLPGKDILPFILFIYLFITKNVYLFLRRG